MTTQHSTPATRILSSLPGDIQTAISAYASESNLTPQAVIEYAISQFLELDTTLTDDGQFEADGSSLLAELPHRLQNQARQYAQVADMPPEFVIELAISHFLDPDSVTFDDCRVKVQQGAIEWLKRSADSPSATAA
jgi:predicted transcriptional regulator